MLLSKNKKKRFKENKKIKRASVKEKADKLICFLNRPVNEARLREIEEEKARIQFYHPFIK